MGSAALKVAAEIPIWEMEKWTLRFEAVSCPICDRFPKIVNALHDACKPPLWHLIISTNKCMDHPDAPCPSYQKPSGNAHCSSPAKNLPARPIQAFALRRR